MPQSIPKGLTQEHVLKALADLDAGIENSFGTPTKFQLVHEGKQYAPKAVIGIAFRHLTGEILHHGKFSGGEAPGQANYELRRLGFKVESKTEEPTEEGKGKVWSSEEVGLLIADYFDMLQLDLLGRQYNKAEHNRQLREALDGRTKPSVEFKHRNVSAVLLKLGLPYIDGYKPAKNFQRSLVDSVRMYLEANSALFAKLDQATESTPDALPKLDSWDRLFEAPPEDTQLPDDPPEPWRSRQGRKIDFVRRDAGNRRLGRLGEKFTVELERRRLRGQGRDDLAKKVEWVSDTSGDGLGVDVLSFDEVDDSERLVEVKTTTQGKYFPFFVTTNEVRCSETWAPPTPEEQVLFLRNIQRLLAEGQFTVSYKFVLLLALADLCVLKGDDSGAPLELKIHDIAEKFMMIAKMYRVGPNRGRSVGDGLALGVA